MSRISPLLQPQELADLLQMQPVVLIDASTGPDAQENYSIRHLQGALHVSLDHDLAAPTDDPAEGGRHPLPPVGDFSRLLGRLGITPASHVVVYDNNHGANAAARFWWMLHAAGHEKVQVLNGGLDEALDAGIPVSSATETARQVPPYPFVDWLLPTVTTDEVETAAQNPEWLVIDVRDKIRYDGITEPIDLVAGHIPGAVNIPFAGNLDSSGLFIASDELKEKFTGSLGGRNISNVIVHCGSGVTACHTLLAIDYAGLGMANLYVGSWSEWSRSGKKLAGGNIDL